MKYLNGNEIVKYNLFNKNFFTKVGSGLEVNAYLIDGEIVKFYKEFCPKNRLNKYSIEKMKLIKTERILLPKSSITNIDGNIMGYTMKKVEKSSRESFFKLDRKSLIKEAKKISKDIKTLNSNRIVVSDLCSDNVIYNKGLYFIDPGSYKFYNKDSFRNYINEEKINEFLLALISLYNNDTYKTGIYSLFASKELKKFLIKNNYTLLKYIIKDFKYNSLDELINDYNKKVR